MTSPRWTVPALLILALVGCASQARPRAKTSAAIAGLARDRESGESIARAEIRVVGSDGHVAERVTDDAGMYTVDPVEPGRYTLHAQFAGQSVTIKNIDVTAGNATYVDVPFTLGVPEPLTLDFGDGRDAQIETYASKHGPSLEGTVGDASTRTRLPGLVVTAISGEVTLQTVTDDHGRYQFETVMPGTYSISTYYSIGGRGQLEVRRSDIRVEPNQRVVVPLWLEVAKQ